MDKRLTVGIIVQARMGSTRLPGKVMMEVSGKSLLEHLVLRLKKVKNADQIIIATTTSLKDDTIEALAVKLSFDFFRGSEANVLQRYYQTAKKYNLDVIVRITADCPLMDPIVVEQIIACYFDNQPVDYVSNTLQRTFPRGLDVEVFSFGALAEAYQAAQRDYELEHVTPYFYQSGKFRVLNYSNSRNSANYRLTVDTQEDFNLIQQIYSAFSSDDDFSLVDVLDLLKKDPNLVSLNAHIRQKELAG